MTLHRYTTCAAVFTAAILGLAAAGDDDAADAGTDADAASSDDDSEADSATLAIETAPPPDVDFATASGAEVTAA